MREVQCEYNKFEENTWSFDSNKTHVWVSNNSLIQITWEYAQLHGWTDSENNWKRSVTAKELAISNFILIQITWKYMLRCMEELTVQAIGSVGDNKRAGDLKHITPIKQQIFTKLFMPLHLLISLKSNMQYHLIFWSLTPFSCFRIAFCYHHCSRRRLPNLNDFINNNPHPARYLNKIHQRI